GEKVLIVSKLKRRFPLPDLLRLIGLARSTFYYQVQSQQKPDKYAELKERIRQVYHKEKGRYGYRRVALAIRKEGPLGKLRTSCPSAGNGRLGDAEKTDF
ncbi:IS3 family transposase, partial [Pseudomonas sp. SIMBA_065]